MSELKALHAFDVYDAYTKTGDDAQVYLKSEADKVIAEKDKEIARLDDLAHAHNIELLCKENLIEELEEERRWRKFSEEKPEHNGIYIVLLGEHTRTLDAYDTDKGKFRTYMPTAWMPLPSSPKEEK